MINKFGNWAVVAELDIDLGKKLLYSIRVGGVGPLNLGK